MHFLWGILLTSKLEPLDMVRECSITGVNFCTLCLQQIVLHLIEKRELNSLYNVVHGKVQCCYG